ncbi:transmembrane protein, putative [Medicago truncatula]|uniref:Transmembrane protein, putative n=1 Tax=Medicago truncatula TaxID=3880 RepID=A0A072V893_MEDTR|nr:transmembrane protein, putative [Medicago truncatula]
MIQVDTTRNVVPSMIHCSLHTSVYAHSTCVFASTLHRVLASAVTTHVVTVRFLRSLSELDITCHKLTTFGVSVRCLIAVALTTVSLSRLASIKGHVKMIVNKKEVQTRLIWPFSVYTNPRRISTWEPLLESLRNKLNSWGNKHVSLGGRVVLLNAVLNAIPIFYLSFFKLPVRVWKKVVRIQREFLWGGGKKVNWVKWSTVCQPRAKGGLGVRDMRVVVNISLLAKWSWNPKACLLR